MRAMITGGAGFIGSAVCRRLAQDPANHVVNVDKLTYAGNLSSLNAVSGQPNYHFVQADICDGNAMLALMQKHRIDLVMNLAAESHVDRSIDGPGAFIDTNVIGTYRLLEAALAHWRSLSAVERERFRFHHISTDEVFGDLPLDQGHFVEETPYAPSSPYSASKAASDHLVRAWHKTYGLPVVLSNCSNNYGPFHFPEKLIPLTILNLLDGKPVPVYGSGANIRDWLFVDDHVKALELIATRSAPGQSYNIGGRAERTNLTVVKTICALLDMRRPRPSGSSYRDFITFVADRPGHDRRYAIDPRKLEQELGWCAEETFESGLGKTVDWYLGNEWWWAPIRAQRYAGARLGVARERAA